MVRRKRTQRTKGLDTGWEESSEALCLLSLQGHSEEMNQQASQKTHMKRSFPKTNESVSSVTGRHPSLLMCSLEVAQSRYRALVPV